MTEPISVRGGPGALAARAADLQQLGAVLARSAASLAFAAARLHAIALASAAPAAAVIDPVGAARVALELLAVLDGPRGLLGLSLISEQLASRVRIAAAAYLAVESAVESQLTAALTGGLRAPAAVVGGASVLMSSRDPAAAAQATLARDPYLADALVNLVTAGHPRPVAAALSAAYPDGRPLVTEQPPDLLADRQGPPRGFADLMAGLARRNEGRPGEIDVRVLTTWTSSGQIVRRAVVDVPGSKDWTFARVDSDIANVGTNLLALGGRPTSYQWGLLQAMKQAGLRPGDEVMFVGHSQGGMVALAAAGQAAASGYRVAAVVTAGSPTGLVRPPPGVSVVALENSSDLVPHLDGRPNRSSASALTITIHRPPTRPLAAHDLTAAYLPGAADVDTNRDPAVLAIRGRLAGFWSADQVSTRVFVVQRQLS